ncbi:hypothetical protein AXX17_AT3G42170 [Arabidopsis thaliana]|uniref:B12D protein n=1 Tax=Arabidopsis thaliana TaxID=3702 RepID=A0A178V7L9_ARATH|nr:hypothetical protein AXX17_AT3G42170 [Arabidopsis thaliana]
MASRWLRPEVYPLFAATGVAVGICAFSLIRNITGNPEVRSVDPPLILIFATSDPFTQLILWNQGVVSNGFCLLNPFFRCTKENRAAGILDNHAEGEKYKENFLRKFVRNKKPEIMPGLNKFFTDPTY